MRADIRNKLELVAERWEFRSMDFAKFINFALNSDNEQFEDDHQRVEFVRSHLGVIEEFGRYWGEILQKTCNELLAETEEETV
jgi:hypothetical protein